MNLHKARHFGEAKSNLGTPVRFGLVTLLFLAGIICLIGSASGPAKQEPMKEPLSTPPSKASDRQINHVKDRIEKLEVSIEAMEEDIANYNNPEEKALVREDLAKERADLQKNQEWLEKAQNSSDTGTCFTADMQVLTVEGAKPIGKINVGDKVLSVDDDGNHVVSEVLKTLADRNRHYYLINGSIKATGLHRFFTDAGWKKAKELKMGDQIQTTTGNFEEIASIEWIPKDDLAVYNLTIAENHNFFISADGKNGFLVHNHGDGGGGGK